MLRVASRPGLWTVSLLLSAVPLGSCGSSGTTPLESAGSTEGEDGGSTGSGQGTSMGEGETEGDDTRGEHQDGPFFGQDVAPILAEHCWSCHAEDGMAPFGFETYEDAEPLGGIIAHVSAERVMPPWAPDASGSCQTYADARWMSDDDIATLQAWVDAGKPAGDLSNLPTPPAPPSLSEVSATLALPGYTPESSEEHPWDEYRCFLLEAPTTSDSTLVAFEVHPGVLEQTHHIGLFGIRTAAGVQAALDRDGEDGKPGWSCFGGPGVPGTTILGAWAPGIPVARYPEGTGVPVDGNRPVIVQVHYNLLQGAFADFTTIDLQLDADATPLSSLIVVNLDLAIPPQTESHTETTTLTHAGGSVEIMAAFPHMHQLGRELRVSVTNDGEETCLMDIPRWDFHWQQTYNYATPIRIDPGDELTLTCTYRSIGIDEVTGFGEGTADEMCAIQFLTRPAGG